MAAFELYLDTLPPAKRKGTAKPALEASDLQAVRRDFAFLVDRDVAAGDVVRAASSADRALIADIGVFDVFTGQGVPDGKKSLAIEVTLAAPRQDADRRGDRRGGGEDRRRGGEGHGRRTPGLAS